jgi:hypothetical protein
VRLLRNVADGALDRRIGAHGLPTGSLTVLALIAANPGSSQSALARSAGLNKSALVGIVGPARGERPRCARPFDERSAAQPGDRDARGRGGDAGPVRHRDGRGRADPRCMGSTDLKVLLALLDRAIAAAGGEVAP